MVVKSVPTDEKSMAYTVINQTNPMVMMAALIFIVVSFVYEVSFFLSLFH